LEVSCSSPPQAALSADVSACRPAKMIFDLVLGGVIAVALAVYLVAALTAPERF
jgi:K+-transporting ATPase KdpF subunit